MRLFVKHKYFILILLLCILILLLPNILRSVSINKSIIGEESYLYLRLSERIIEEKELPDYDSLSYGGRAIHNLMLWPILIAGLGILLKVDVLLASKILPFLFGIGSFIIFYFLLKRFKLPNKIIYLSLLMLIISSPFLYLFSVSTPYTAATFFILLGLLLFFKENKNYFFFGGVSFLMVIFFSLPLLLVFLPILFFYIIINDRNKLKSFLFIFLFIAIIASIYYGRILYLYGPPESLKFSVNNTGINSILQKFVSDLGAKYGLSIFAILLTIFGLSVLWENKKKNYVIYLILIALFILLIFFDWIMFYINFFIIILASFGLIKLIKIKWESSLIKKLVLIIFIGGLIFSSLSYITRLSRMEPTNEQLLAIEYLRIHGNPNTTVFSYYPQGYWINYANKKNIMDANFIYAPDLNERFEDSQTIFFSKDLEGTKKLLDKYSVNYIWIDGRIKHLLYHDEQEVYLLYILKYSKHFEKVYQNQEVELWRYKKLI